MEKFHKYTYGRKVTVQSDHKPLEHIHKKPLLSAPKRLQRMLLRLQKYDANTYVPGYPQSNGKAESAVKTAKRLMLKAKLAGQVPYLALLDHRNTPTQGVNTSPAQRLLNK